MVTIEMGAEYSGFTAVSVNAVPYYNAEIYKFIHKSGAAAYYCDRGDGQLLFAAGFRTPSEDDSGVYHAVEHCCLGGSESYPLRELWSQLLKSSLTTDFNGFTDCDRTVYHFGSTVQKDYSNVMSVLLDCLFHPLFLREKRIFDKEVRRFQPDGSGGLTINGVIYNEMPGKTPDAMSAAVDKTRRTLYSDTPYAYNAGGAPTELRDLTYEKVCEAYKTAYRADNCTFYLSGELDLPAQLARIAAVLDSLPAPQGEPPRVPPLSSACALGELRSEYAPAPGEGTEENTALALSYTVDPDEPYLPLAFMLLSGYLAQTPQSPLPKAVFDAGFSQEMWMNVQYFAPQTLVTFSVTKTEPENGELFRQTVTDALRAELKRGFDRDKLEDYISMHDSVCRHNSRDVWSGINIMSSVMQSVAATGDYIPNDGVRLIRDALERDGRLFEHLIEKYILNNDKCVLVVSEPTKSSDGEIEKAAAYLKTAREKMSECEYEELKAESAAFDEYYGAPESEEARRLLPRLSAEDLGKLQMPQAAEEKTLSLPGGDAIYLRYINREADGFINASFNFDVRGIPPEKLPYLWYYCNISRALGTLSRTAENISDEAKRYNAGFGGGISCRLRTDREYRFYYIVNLTVPAANLSGTLELLRDIFHNTVFDKATLSRELKKLYNNSAEAKRQNAAVSANLSAACRFSSAAVQMLAMNGEKTERRLKEIVENFDAEYPALLCELTDVYRAVYNAEGMVVTYAGDEADEAAFIDGISGPGLEFSENRVCTPEPGRPENVGIAVLEDAGACFLCADMKAAGYSGSPSVYSMISQYIGSDYLHNELRMKGGAYGGGCFLSDALLFGMNSYRDPNVSRTYDIFNNTPLWLRANVPDKDRLADMIIRTASNLKRPKSELDRANAAFNAWFARSDLASVPSEFEALKAASEKDFYFFADCLEQALKTASISAAARREKLEQSGLFDRIIDR